MWRSPNERARKRIEELEDKIAAYEAVIFNVVPRAGMSPEATAAVIATILRLRQDVEAEDG